MGCLRTIGLLLVGVVASAIVEAQEPSYTSQETQRCSYQDTTEGTQIPAGGSPIPDPDPATVDTADKCQKHCTDNAHLQDIKCLVNPICSAQVCEYAVFDPAAVAGTTMCVLYPPTAPLVGTLTAGKTVIKMLPSADSCPDLGGTTAAAAGSTDAGDPVTTPATGDATSPASGGDANPKCCEWAKANECEINPFFMKVECKVACGTPTATTENANTVPSEPSAECAPTAPSACKDESTDCTKWALDKQCDENPYFMLVNCASACRACEDGTPKTYVNACGDTDQPPIAGCENSVDDCNFWASIGECSRNAAWMPTNCCAACRNLATIYENCPLAGKAPFTGEG